jgi:hypothetical protein
MADKLYFSRDAKVYCELTSSDGSFQGLWDIPVLDGFSFSQATNQSEIGLAEMEGASGISRRGRRLFTDSLAPAEWSFSTYMRPTDRGSSKMHLVDQVLWAAMAGANQFSGSGVTATGPSLDGDYSRTTSDKATSTGVVHDEVGGTLPSGGTGALLNFGESNRATLPKITLYFVFQTDETNPMVYKLTNAIVNECSVDFDIDGIATNNWSGFAKEVTDMQSAGKVNVGMSAPSVSADLLYLDSGNDFRLSVPIDADNGGGASPVYDVFRTAITDGVSSTSNFIRNRLTQVEVRGQNPDVMEGKRLAISGESSGVFTTAAHGLKAGDVVRISGLTGADAANFNNLNTFVISTGLTATAFKVSLTSGGSAITGTVTTSGSPVVDTGIYSFTLTGGSINISNNVTYLVPEEIGTINKPIEGVTGARAIGGNFTCYLVYDDAAGNTGASSDFFADLVDANKGLTKVVNNFDVTFKVGGTTSGNPRVNFNFPKTHIDVPTHAVEDVISLDTNFGAYTEDFDSVDEFNLEVFGVTA